MRVTVRIGVRVRTRVRRLFQKVSIQLIKG